MRDTIEIEMDIINDDLVACTITYIYPAKSPIQITAPTSTDYSPPKTISNSRCEHTTGI